ncbi:hypothetical protein GCM10020219_042040 [Nonomuraea dietziae]
MAGVSQTTVSLVLNGRAEGEVRISPETRDRVLQVIRETGYVADPAARRLVERRNRIYGVFTYEAVFPAESADFYHPFLVGIEECAEEAGCDLLLFTSAKVEQGEWRRIFSAESRIRLADGCVLLGRTIDRDDLSRLLTEGIPFVSVGRRDDAGGPVPYVGADYPPAVRAPGAAGGGARAPAHGLRRDWAGCGVLRRPAARFHRRGGRDRRRRRAPGAG